MASSGDLSISMVLVQCEDTLKTHIDVNKVANTMLKSEKADEVLNKATKKHLEKSKNKADTKFLLAVLKRLELPGFALFLESLEQIGDKNHLTALTTIATHIPSLPLPSPETSETAISEAAKKINRIYTVFFKPTKHRDVPSDSEQVLAVESLIISDEPPLDFSQSVRTTVLPGTIQPEQTEIQSATVSIQSLPHNLSGSGDDNVTVKIGKDGGLLYSPVHGITVNVPASAVPHCIQKFELVMTASLSSAIPIGTDYIPCSAIVSLTTNPKIEKFSDHVMVSVPHCAVSVMDYPEFYCLLSHSDDQDSFEEDTNIEVDFIRKWRYFSFKTRHFTRYVAAGKRVSPRKQPMRLAKVKSKSLEHHCKKSEFETALEGEFHRSVSDPLSQSTYLPNVQYALGMFTPLCKEGSTWRVVFLTCLDVQTGYAVMEQDALRLLRLGGVHLLDPGCQRISFMFKKDCSTIEFSPPECSRDGWSFKALRTPAIIAKVDMEYHTVQPRQDTSYAPHGLTYVVTKRVDAAVSVCQQFRVNGIVSRYGDQIKSRDVSFTLVAESASSQASQNAVGYIIPELYHTTSKFLGAIRGEISPREVELKPDDPETIIFIAELSFCLTSAWEGIAKNLMLDDYNIKNIKAYYDSFQEEAAFQMILMWLQSFVGPRVSLQYLIDALYRNNIEIRVHNLNLLECMYSHKEEHFHQLSSNTVAEISRRIASQWKFVGRLLGMTESYISSLAVSQDGSGVEGHYKLMEQTVAMLDQWKRINGPQATLLKLKNVIYAVHKHSGHKLRDAVDFLAMPFQ